MLITTEARPNAASHIKDLGETVERLPIAGDIHEHLAETARLNSAQDSATQQGAVVDVIKKQNESMKGSATANDKFPELAKPHLVLSSPAGIATSTARSTHIASDGNTALTTGRSLSIASGDSLIASIRQTFRLVLAACIAMSSWPSESQAAPQASYKIRDSKPMKDASIQIVSFDSVAGLDQTAMKKINTALIAASAWFGREAKKCSTYAEGHPWGYELTLDKVLLSEKYLSVVFAKSTVCAGSPDLEKEARVFSIPTGNLVPAMVLFKQIFPTAKLVSSMSPNKELIQLDEEMAEALIGDSREVLKTYDSECEFYLKHASYRIWMDGKNLILFPEFIQPASFCQKEYLIQPEE